MKVILTAADLLPLVKDLLAKRYPEVQFVMRRKGGLFSSEAELVIECELEE